MAIGIGIAVTALLVLLAIASGRFRARPGGRADAAYRPWVQATATQVLQADTMMAGSVIYVDGTVRNSGNRPVTSVQVELRFQDPYGQLAQLERATVIDSRLGVLAPGAARGFRLGFDHISSQWNQAPPAVRVVSVFVR